MKRPEEPARRETLATPLRICGIGMRTSAGANAAQSCNSIRTGVTRLRELGWAKDRRGEPLIGGEVDYLTGGLEGVERLLAMSIPAAREAVEEATSSDRSALSRKWAVVLVTGSWEAGLRPPPQVRSSLGETDLVGLAGSLGLPGTALVALESGGQAGFFTAIARAGEIVHSGRAEYVLLGGVDSLLQLEILYDLDLYLRLKTGYSSDGFVPGEAAAFVVVKAHRGAARGEGPGGIVAGLGVAFEERALRFKDPCLGTGLTEALRGAFRSHPDAVRSLDGIVCDLDGERYRANEWALAYPRALGACPGTPPVWCPAESLGNVGAAMGPTCLCVAAMALRRGYAPGPRLLVWGSAEQGHRGSVFMTDETGLRQSSG